MHKHKRCNQMSALIKVRRFPWFGKPEVTCRSACSAKAHTLELDSLTSNFPSARYQPGDLGKQPGPLSLSLPFMWAPTSSLVQGSVGGRARLPTLRCCCQSPHWSRLQSQARWVRALGVLRAARAAYLLGIAAEHRVDQFDPVGQAGGNHIAWAVGRPDSLVQVACLSSRSRRLAGSW